jgi:hypothetical protein
VPNPQSQPVEPQLSRGTSPTTSVFHRATTQPEPCQRQWLVQQIPRAPRPAPRAQSIRCPNPIRLVRPPGVEAGDVPAVPVPAALSSLSPFPFPLPLATALPLALASVLVLAAALAAALTGALPLAISLSSLPNLIGARPCGPCRPCCAARLVLEIGGRVTGEPTSLLGAGAELAVALAEEGLD